MRTKNTVTLINHTGTDRTVALTAWASTGWENDVDLSTLPVPVRQTELFEATVKNKKKGIKDLLMFLGKAGHHSPFEHTQFQFIVTSDIATHIQILKHRIGVSINTESARYKELEDKWHIPEDWDSVLEGKWADELESFNHYAHQKYHEALTELTPLLGRKRAKESARFFLPYSKQLSFWVSLNLRSLAHFVNLRASGHAQAEIEDVAMMMLEEIMANCDVPICLEALGLIELHEKRMVEKLKK